MNDNLLKALLNKVDEVLNGGSDVASASPDNYVAWCSPGMPFQAEDLQFAVKGIDGQDAVETKNLIRTAAEFSRLVNSIPSSNSIGGTFEQAGSLVWDVYSQVLRFSKVPKMKLTEEEEAKIKKFRGLLVTTKKVKDILTDEEKEMQVDSPLVVAYKEKMAAYTDVVREYNLKRLEALNSESKQAVQDFALNAGLYRNKVKYALNDWVTNGYKLEYEQIGAFIKQVSQRDMTLLKADLESKLRDAKMTDPNSGGDFFLTGFYPGSFINSDAGWTQFTFKASSKDTYLKESHQATSAYTKMSWGLFRLNADGKHTKDEFQKSMESGDFEMKFKITQIPLGRPWFSPDFLTNNSWNWDQSIYKLLSDGKTPPSGKMIAYPTSAIFIKDVTITSSSMKDVHNEITKSLSAGGSVGWGPFTLNARHSQNSKEVKTHFNDKANSLTVEGMQLIALKCFALPKAPDCKLEDLG